MQNPYIPLHFVRNLNIPLHAGLGTAFFCVRHATFFCILLKNATFFFAFFLNFWWLMKPKITLRSFAFYLKERAFFQKNARSFLTLKKHLNVLFLNFLWLMKPKKNVALFLRERAFFLKECTFFLGFKSRKKFEKQHLSSFF